MFYKPNYRGTHPRLFPTPLNIEENKQLQRAITIFFKLAELLFALKKTMQSLKGTLIL